MVHRMAQLALMFLVSLLLMFGCNKGCLEYSLRKSSPKLRIAPQISQGQLDNGVAYFYLRNDKPQARCFLRLHVGVGSFAEKDDELGMAHLVEHMAFNDRAVSKDISLAEWFQKNGMSFGPDANAYTATDHTVYKIDLPSCDKAVLKEALGILRSFADGLHFDEKAIAKEKNIIDAEELESKNAHGELSEKIVEHLYAGTLFVSRPVLGKADKRAQFTKEMLMNFYHQWYHPKNLTVMIVGDYGDTEAQALISSAFGDCKAKTEHKKQPLPGQPHHQIPIFIVPEKSLAHVELIFSIQANKIIKPRFSLDLIKDRLAFDLALAMVANSLAKQAQENKDMIRQTTINGFMLDNGLYELSLNTASQAQNFERSFIDSYMLLRSKAELGFEDLEFKTMRGTFLDSIDQAVVNQATWGSDNWAAVILGHINRQSFANTALDYQTWARPILSQLTAKDCQNALAKALKSGQQFMFALGAIENTPHNVKNLGELLKKAQKEKLGPASSSEAVSFQYQVPQCISKLKAKPIHIQNIDAYSLALSANLEVVVKPTQVKQDQIVLGIFTDEGFATMNARDFTLARMAQSVLPEGGLGKHPPEQVPDLLKTKFFSAHMAVLADRIQAIASTRGQDLRFALEYLIAYIVDPLYAESTLQRAKENVKIAYQELKHSMWAPLQNEFPKDLAGQDHRVGRARLEDLLNISRADLLSWHHQFIGSRKLKIVVVGDVDPMKVFNDIDCVMTPLLAHAQASAYKQAPKIAYKSGIHRVYSVPTKDDASKVVLRYPLMFPGQLYPDHRLAILQNLIQETLRLKLREKKQVTYSPSVMVSASKNPQVQNWIDILIAAPKSEAESIRRDAESIINKLAIKGVNSAQLVKAKEPYLAQAVQALNENDYWLFILADNFKEATTMGWVNTISADIQAIGAPQINILLRKYFRQGHASSAVVHADQN